MRVGRLPIAVGLLLSAGAIACGEQSRVGGTERVDSAGVTIVTYGGPDRPLSLRQTRRIGVVEGEAPYQLFQVRHVVVGPMDTVYVVNAGSSTIRVFAPDGTFVREFGGAGSGPGEFESVFVAHLIGDTVAVIGSRGGIRVSLFKRAGEYLGAWDPGDPRESRVSLVGGGGGVWVGSVHPGGFRSEREWVMVHDTARFYRLDPADGTAAAPIANLPAGRRMHPSVTGALFDARAGFGVDGAGRLYHSHGEPYRIDVYDPDGRLVRSVRREVEAQAIDPDWVQRYLERVDSIDATLPPGAVSNSRWTGQGRVDAMIAEHLPPLGRLLVGRDGAIWVERRDRDPTPDVTEFERLYGNRLGGRETVWDVFEDHGAYVGTVMLPATFTPHCVTGTSVTGVELDDLDVERVVTYRAEP